LFPPGRAQFIFLGGDHKDYHPAGGIKIILNSRRHSPCDGEAKFLRVITLKPTETIQGFAVGRKGFLFLFAALRFAPLKLVLQQAGQRPQPVRLVFAIRVVPVFHKAVVRLGNGIL
jgi:hypothetical protein